MKLFLKYWLPVLIWLAFMFIGSTDTFSAPHTSRFLVPFLRWLSPNISFAALESIQLIVRKFSHLSEYAILATLLWRALRSATNLRLKMSILFAGAWFACAVFAASDEFHQSFVPSREASAIDVLIDIGGAFFGLVICSMIAQRKSRRVFAANRQPKIENRN